MNYLLEGKQGVGMFTEMKSSNLNYIHSPDKKSFQTGLEFQDFVCVELAKHGIILQNLSSKKYQYETGENLQGFEIKFDSRFLDTSRLSIEIAEKSNRDVYKWTASGIYRVDNTWLYIQGNYDRLYIFPKNFLIKLHESKKYEEAEFNGTIKKFYLPLEDAEKYCAKRIDFYEGVF